MRIFVAALALPCLGMMCAPSAAPPPPDDCASPGGEPVAALALGPERLGDMPFEPWAASDTAYVSHGAQGGDMLGVSLELTGDVLPACVAQRTEVRQDGEVLAAEEVAINTYEEAGDGTRATNTLWLIFPDGAAPSVGSQLEVTAEAGGATASARLAVVGDRHRLIALAPAAPTARVGETIEFALDSLHAPAGASNLVELTTRGDPGVLGLPAATATIFSDAEILYIPAVGPGTAELVVRYGEQEVRAAATVE